MQADNARLQQQLHECQAQLNAVTAAFLRHEEQERQRIAQGLHDEIAQALALVKGKIGTFRNGSPNSYTEQLVRDTTALIDQVIHAIRTLTFDLSAPVPNGLCLEAALQSLGEQMTQEHGLQFQFSSDRQPKTLPENVRVALYRIARELLVNIVKHAHAMKVSMALKTVDDLLLLTVVDNGIGFVETKLDSGVNGRDQQTFGLFSVRRQLESLGGDLQMHSSVGHGTQVQVSLPLGVAGKL